MSEPPQEGPDDRWLDVLSGKRPADPRSADDVQAQAVRAALQQRRDRLDAQVPEADAALFEQLRFRLRREGLDPRRQLWQRPALWGLAASLVLGVALVIQLAGPDAADNAQDTLRGDGSATMLIVPDVELRLAELQRGLQAAGAAPRVQRLEDGRVFVQVEATPAVLDWLGTQRIEPTVKEGVVTLVLSRLASR